MTKFKLEPVQGAPVRRKTLLEDLVQVAKRLDLSVISQRQYDEHGKYSSSTISRRFGSWNQAVSAANLEPANEVNLSDGRLFENISKLWEFFGRQPRRRELSDSPSTISQGPYNRRFKSWMVALENFVEYANTLDAISPIPTNTNNKLKASRNPSLRLRFRVLKRDNFTCVSCGSSPTLSPGLVLHVDHIAPWSLGGETKEGNLQTLCEKCNLGKSNVL